MSPGQLAGLLPAAACTVERDRLPQCGLRSTGVLEQLKEHRTLRGVGRRQRVVQRQRRGGG